MNGACFTLFKSITVDGLSNTTAVLPSAKENIQPYKVPKAKNDGHFSVKLEFQGHYEEPNLNLKVPFDMLDNMEEVIYVMRYYVKEGKWETVMIHDKDNTEMGPSEFTTDAVQTKTQSNIGAAKQTRSNSSRRDVTDSESTASSNRGRSTRE